MTIKTPSDVSRVTSAGTTSGDEGASTPEAGKTYTARGGETFEQIAKTAYGDGTLAETLATRLRFDPSKPLKAGETLELPSAKEVAKSQFESNGGKDVAESKPSTTPSVKDGGDLTGGLERPHTGGVSVENAGSRATPPSIEIESLAATHDGRATRFDEKWSIIRPSDFSTDMDFPNAKFPDNPAVFEVLSKDGKPPYPFRIKLKTPLKGETLKSDQLLRATLQIETARDSGLKSFSRISSRPDGGVRIDNPRFDPQNAAFATLGDNAGARSLTIDPSGATELIQPFGDSLKDAPQSLPTSAFVKMPLKEEFRLAGAENAASVAEALCIWAKGGSSELGSGFEFEIEPLHDGTAESSVADFEIEPVKPGSTSESISDIEIEPLKPEGNKDSSADTVNEPLAEPTSIENDEESETPPLIANEERLDAGDTGESAPSNPVTPTEGSSESSIESAVGGVMAGGTEPKPAVEKDEIKGAADGTSTAVSGTNVSETEPAEIEAANSAGTIPAGPDVSSGKTDTALPTSDKPVGDVESKAGSESASVEPSSKSTTPAPAPSSTTGGTPPATTDAGVSKPSALAPDSGNPTPTNTTGTTPSPNVSNASKPVTEAVGVKDVDVTPPTVTTAGGAATPTSSSELASIASKLSKGDPLKDDLAKAKKKLDAEVETNRTAEGDRHLTDAFKKVDPEGKVVFEKNKVTTSSESESTTELADGTKVATNTTSKGSVSKNELTSDQSKTVTTTGTDGASTTVSSGHGVKLTDKGAGFSTNEVTTEKDADGNTVTSGASKSINIEKDKLSLGGTTNHATSDAEGNKTAHDTATNLTTDGSGENFNISHSDKRSESNADGSGNTRATSGSVTLKDGSMSSSVKHDRSDTTVSDDGTKTTTRMGGGLDIGPDSFKATGSGGRTVTDADGNSSNVDVNAAVTNDSIAAGVKTSETEKHEDGGSTTSDTTGNVKIDRSKMAGDIGHTVTNVDADGNKDTTAGKVRFDTDGKIGMDVSKETSDTDGNKEKHSASVDYDHDSKKIDVKTSHAETTVGEDGLNTSTNTDVKVGYDADDGRLDVGTTHGRVVDDGQTKTESTDKVGVGLSEDNVAVNIGRSDRRTEKDGTSDGLATNVGVDLGSDKSSISAGFNKDSTSVDEDSDKHKVGTSGNVGVDFADDKTSIRADLGVETEDSASGKEGEKSTRKSKHKVGIDTGNRDVFVSTGGSQSNQDKVKKTATGGNVAFSMRDGVTVEGTHETHNADSGADAKVHGGIRVSPDGNPSLFGDVEIGQTKSVDGGTTTTTSHGVGGGLSRKELDIGYRYKVETSDGVTNLAHVDIDISKDKVNVAAGYSASQVSKVGTTTTLNSTGGEILVGKNEISVRARTAEVVTEDGRILPTHMSSLGGMISLRGKQVSTVGDKVEDKESPNFGKFRVETNRSYGGTLGASYINWLGGTLNVSGDKEVKYITHLSDDRTRTLHRAIDQGKFKEYVAGLTLVDAAIDIPDVSKPDSLQVGDEITMSMNGSIEAGLVSTVYLLQAGVKVTVGGEFELEVAKTGENEVEVEVSPTQIFGVKVFGDAVIADASVAQMYARQLSQRFKFDLSTDNGRRAYRQALQGKLPGGLGMGDLDSTKHNLNRIRTEFPEGIERLEVRKASSRQTAAEAKIGFLMLQTGIKGTRTNTTEVVSDGIESANYVTRTKATEKKTLISGNEDYGVSVQLKTTAKRGEKPGDYVTAFDGFNVTAFFKDTKVRGQEYGDDMISKLNTKIDAGLEVPVVDGGKRSRTLEATVEFQPQDIADIRTASAELIQSVSEFSKVSVKDLTSLKENMAKEEDDIAAARILARFISRHGMEGMGAAMKLALLEQGDIDFKTSSGAYTDTVKESEKYLLENSKTVTGAMSKSAFTKRFKEGERLVDSLDNGLNQLDGDPVMRLEEHSAERDKIRANLSGKREAVLATNQFDQLSPEDAIQLYVKLDRGWTTGTQKRAQQRLLDDCGLTVHHAGFTSTTASGIKKTDEGQTETSIRSDGKLIPLFGDERTQVSAAVQKVKAADGSLVITGMTLETRVFDESLYFNELNDDFVDKLNTAFGYEFEAAQKSYGKGLDVVVKQKLSAEHLDKFIEIDELDMREQMRAAGASEDEARKFSGFLAGAKSRDDVSRVLEHMVQDCGLWATGAVLRIARDNEINETEFTSRSGRMDGDLKSLEGVAKKHTGPFKAAGTPKDLAARFKEVARAKKDLIQLKERIMDFPFFSDGDRDTWLKKADELGESMDKSLDLSHLDHDNAVRLYRLMDRGWTSSTEKRAMERIKADTGLQTAETDFWGRDVVGRSERRSEDGSVTINASRSVRTDSWFSSGKESEAVTASAVIGADGAMSSLTLKGQISDTKVTRPDFEKKFVDRLNSIFGFKDKTTGKSDDAYDLKLDLSLELSPEDVQKLSEVSVRDVGEVARGSKTGLEELSGFLGDMRSAADDEAKVKLVLDYVQKHGLDGMGDITRVLKAEERVKLSEQNSLEKGLRERIKDLLSSYEGTKLSIDMSKKELTMRFHELNEVERDIEKLRRAVKQDPYVDDVKRDAVIEETKKLLETARASFDPGHLSFHDRHQLIQELERGWTTKEQYEAIDALKYR